jgi:putative tryptophan/tyrosine transport system substrate-binding protein
MMRRREFITLGGAAATWPLAARAQQQKMVRIGVLVGGDADGEPFLKAFREALREINYIEWQNVVLEFRSAEGLLNRLPELAAELVRLKVDIIVALYTPCVLAAKQATRDIPIIMLAGDPLGTGLVASLARPGGNMTGLSFMAAETNAKSIELFRDMLPSLRRVGVLANTADPVFAKSFLEHVRLAGGATGIEIKPIVMVSGPDELDAAFAAMVAERPGAVVVQGSLSSKHVADLALGHRLPAASVPRAFADAGGLMSYGADGPVLFRRTAAFVQKILQGKSPADMPVEQPAKFELVINLKTAKALGLDVPLFLQQRADEVIE